MTTLTERLAICQERQNRVLAALRHALLESNVADADADALLAELEETARVLKWEAGRDGWLRAARLYRVEPTQAQGDYEQDRVQRSPLRMVRT